jgi:hypothetical protein
LRFPMFETAAAFFPTSPVTVGKFRSPAFAPAYSPPRHSERPTVESRAEPGKLVAGSGEPRPGPCSGS